MNRADGVPRSQGYYLGTWEECEAVAGHELDGLPFLLSHVDRPGEVMFGGFCAHCGEFVGTGWAPDLRYRGTGLIFDEQLRDLKLTLSTARAA